ncbi:hypothetical protein EIP86_009393 [Pleurotus ostreatoroseus]|nr:hypothetical protein EIP86_009393 [Pleurotus ostreatoroseus]
MIKDRCENIDTLLVFAGLFSAVVTAFNVEAYQALLSPGDSPPPVPQNAAVRLNVIWFCSLIFSLIAASLGMLVRQWLLEYLKGHFTSSPEYVRVRYYRWDNLHRWHVFDLEAGMTILLQIALILFFVGISDLLRQLNPIVGWFITGVVALWLLFVAGSVLSPAIASRCPYKVFFFKTLTTWTRRTFSRCLGKRNWDESAVRPDRTFDIPSMIAADDVLRDDALLMDTLRPCLMTAQGRDVITFIRAMLEHRLQKTRTESLYAFLYVRSLARLTNLALEAILHILLDALEAELGVKDKGWRPATYGWIEEGLVFLFGALNYAYYKDRHLGKAMDRGILLQSQLVRLNDDFIRACLLLLVKYEHVPGEIRELTTGGGLLYNIHVKRKLTGFPLEFARVIRIAQQLVDSKLRLSSVQICRVMLSMVQLQHTETMQGNRHKFVALLSSLSVLIAKAPREAECRHCVSSCLQACRDIQGKAREFIPEDLIGALNSLSWDIAQGAVPRSTHS